MRRKGETTMLLAQVSETKIANLDHLIDADITEDGVLLRYVDGSEFIVTDEFAATLSLWLIGALTVSPFKEDERGV